MKTAFLGNSNRDIRPHSADLGGSRTRVLFAPKISALRPNLTIRIPGRLRRHRNAVMPSAGKPSTATAGLSLQTLVDSKTFPLSHFWTFLTL